MKIELLPCPFCGSDEQRVMEVGSGLQKIICHQCGASGPGGAETLPSACDSWNRRPTEHTQLLPVGPSDHNHAVCYRGDHPQGPSDNHTCDGEEAK